MYKYLSTLILFKRSYAHLHLCRNIECFGFAQCIYPSNVDLTHKRTKPKHMCDLLLLLTTATTTIKSNCTNCSTPKTTNTKCGRTRFYRNKAKCNKR